MREEPHQCEKPNRKQERQTDLLEERRVAAQKEDGCQCLFRFDPKPVIS